MRKNVDTWERALSIAVGAGLLARGIGGRDERGLSAALGAAFVARGASGYCPVNAALGRGRARDDTREALGGERGVRVRESVTIARAPQDVYRFWRELTNLPSFMSAIDNVELLGAERSRWTTRRTAGVRWQWDAVIINDLEPELIAWQSLPGSDVASAGSVHFKPLSRGGTEVTVVMQYDAPGGKGAAALAALVGQNPVSSLREDLRRLKGILETGELPTSDRQPAGARSASFRLLQSVQS